MDYLTIMERDMRLHTTTCVTTSATLLQDDDELTIWTLYPAAPSVRAGTSVDRTVN